MVSPNLFKKYYCKIKGKNYGPLTLEELKDLAIQGQLQISDKVSLTFPTKEWMQASSIFALKEIFESQSYSVVAVDAFDGFANNSNIDNRRSDNKRLINCKTCGARISKNASKCPQCGEDAESSGTKIIMLGFVGLITLGVMIIIGAKFLGEKETVFRQELIRENKNAIEKENEDSTRRLMNGLNESDRIELKRKR